MPTVTMVVPAPWVSEIAKMFHDEGLEAFWDTPFDKSTGAEREVMQVVYYLKGNAGSGLVGSAAYDATRAAVRRIRERFPSARPYVGQTYENDTRAYG